MDACDPPPVPESVPVQRWLPVAAVSVWAVILLGISLRGLPWSRSSGVYPIFAEAARRWLVGDDLYLPSMQPYRYSPPATVLLLPFALLPDRLGGTLWRLVNAAAYLAALGWWVRAVLPRPLSPAERAGLFLLVIPLSLGSLNNAQSNPLVLALLLAGVAAAAIDRWPWAALSVTGAVLFKGYPLAIALLLAALFPLRFAPWFGAALLLGAGLPFLFQDAHYVVQQYRAWLACLGQDDRRLLPTTVCYRDWGLLCRVCGIPLSTAIYRLVPVAVGGGIALLCGALRLAGPGRRHLLTMLLALGCCWMTLFGPATESCTYILLAPTLAWCLLDAPRGRWHPCLHLSALLFLSTVLASWFPWGRWYHSFGPHPLAAALLLTHVLLQLRLTTMAPRAQSRPASRQAA